jgi:hypothetical protein
VLGCAIAGVLPSGSPGASPYQPLWGIMLQLLDAC